MASLKKKITDRALELGFADIGFAPAQTLEHYLTEIESRPPGMYDFVLGPGFDLRRAARVRQKHPWAGSIIVLLRSYHRLAFPAALTGRFGRCYLVDERKAPGVEHSRLSALLDFLKAEGLRCELDLEMPARMASAAAGLTTYGQNCFVFSRRALAGSSWLESIPIVISADLSQSPAAPPELGCPDWCRGACIAACPTGALYAPLKMNPKLCIAYNTYYGPRLTPRALRAPMGQWIYGCDRCQEVCPRNQPWLNQDLAPNPELEARVQDFETEKLLAMSPEYHAERLWPWTFYISRRDTARLRMNAARALGNSQDRAKAAPLITALDHDPSPEVRAMAAWALGRLGGARARLALDAARSQAEAVVLEEIEAALGGPGFLDGA